MSDTNEQYAPPPAFLSWLEPTRSWFEFATLPFSMPFLWRAPKGDGHPVLVLPGFLGGDNSTSVLRYFLESRGYTVYPWSLGRNLGPRGDLEEKMVERVVHLAAHHERKISLVGWSLGGIYARQIARDVPNAVRQVITIGSPFGSPGHGGTNIKMKQIYEVVSGDRIHHADAHAQAHFRRTPPVPSTAIFSRSDGIAVWQVCSEPDGPYTDSVEVAGSHTGLGHNPQVLFICADRLAQPEDGWQPFDRNWMRVVWK